MPRIDSVETLIQFAEEATPYRRRACGKIGSQLNPYKVSLREHEKKAMVFRYLVYKGLETALFGMMTSGQMRGTQTDLPGVPGPIEMPNVPVELALRQGWVLAIGGQVEKSSWFYFAGSPNQLFFMDSKGDVTAVYYPKTGETRELTRSSVSDFVDKIIDQEQRDKRFWDDAYRSGRAI